MRISDWSSDVCSSDLVIDTDDRAYMGKPNLPNTNIGFTRGFTYSNFSFSVLLQSALNFDIYMGNGNAGPFKTNLQPIHQGRWTSETAETATFPALTTTSNGRERKSKRMNSSH